MRTTIFSILCLSLVFLNIINCKDNDKDINSSCHGIDHCVNCHKGHTLIFWVCDQCDAGYGIDTKYDSDDLCAYCSSVVPHCLECSNPINAWSCHKCEDGYQLVIIPLQDDRCIKSGNNNSTALEFLQ